MKFLKIASSPTGSGVLLTAKSSASTTAWRFWEIDGLRGLVIITMAIYHLMYDLVAFRAIPFIHLQQGFWKYFQRFTAVTFIMLAGVSVSIVARRYVVRNGSDTGLFRKIFLRGLIVFAWGMVLSLGAWTLGRVGMPIGFVDFGVLHLIGFSIMVSKPFLRFRWLNLALWALFNVAGSFLQQPTVSTRWLVWLGFVPPLYFPFDFFPLIPWFGVFLLGIFIGNMLYGEQGRRFHLPDLSPFFPLPILRFLGRHSLVIYLIHQPLLFGILILLGIIDIG